VLGKTGGHFFRCVKKITVNKKLHFFENYSSGQPLYRFTAQAQDESPKY
jgi:hypothetical protein